MLTCHGYPTPFFRKILYLWGLPKTNIGKNNYFHIKRFFSYVAPKYSDFVFILLLKLVHMSKFPLDVMGVIQESSVGHSRIIQESFGSQSGIFQESFVSHQGIIWELESSKNHQIIWKLVASPIIGLWIIGSEKECNAVQIESI